MSIAAQMTQLGHSPASLGYPENVVEHASDRFRDSFGGNKDDDEDDEGDDDDADYKTWRYD
ncbi:hypothetical protein BGX23_001368 [Mortierella sp. AD031]|nr:hypothetical protein BGX23_001368 [Mortierella sp. AD031]